jgi:hypothetical protein
MSVYTELGIALIGEVTMCGIEISCNSFFVLHGCNSSFYLQIFFTFVIFYIFTLLTFFAFYIQSLRLKVNFSTFNLNHLKELHAHVIT